MIFLQSVQLWEVVLGKNDGLAVKSALELQETLSDGVDGIFETVVFGHYIHVVENLCEVNPILHEEDACPINVDYLYRGNE